MMTPLEQLENAIRKRAQTLAETQLQSAQQQRERLLAESAKRLQLQEERATEMAKAIADQEGRRRIQASEIKMQAELDQLRWTLVQAVMAELREHLKQLTHQHPAYENLLKRYLHHASQFFEAADLVVEVNAPDYALLSSQWPEFLKEFPKFTLIASAQHFTGGLLVRDPADCLRVDNTFEGLIARMENELYQVIIAQLLASATTSMRNL